MYLSKMLFKSLRELPSDIELESHKIMLKSSMIHQAGSGIYTYLPAAWKSLKKIESIIRQEMDAIGGQELRMPVIQPKDIWSKSGRFEAMGDELFKLLDRRKKPFVLAPTHEEILTLIVKDIISSYKSLPQILYQIQTKLRDEPRPRGGLLRVREFVMKDAYSFDINQEGLDENYNKFSTAYHNIYERCGLEVIKIEADSGAIGGKDSHEFVAISESGEDTVVLCNNCNYAANTEKAIFAKTEFTDESNEEKKEISTPNIKTIPDLCKFLNIPEYKTIKAMFYETKDKFICVVIRGDYEINELKLARILGTTDFKPASQITLEKHNIPSGSASPINKDIYTIADDSLEKGNNFVAGANKENYHISNINLNIDFKADIITDIAKFPDKAKCQNCSNDLYTKKAIEVGHIFKLGTIYSEKFNTKFLTESGTRESIEMGCYGIGTGRLLAAIIEQNHDENGPVFPKSISPYDIIITALNNDIPEVKAYSEEIYNLLNQTGFSTVLDDRKESPGVKFSDADLLGFPTRITVSKRLEEKKSLEIKLRKNKDSITINKNEILNYLKKSED